MDRDRLAALFRSLTSLPTRRALLGVLGSSALGSALVLAMRPSDAKKGGKGKGKGKGKKGKGKKKRKKKFTFRADAMTGANEVPPIVTMGTGSAQFTIQGATICGTFTASNLSSAVNMKHIHPGVAGTNNPPVVDFSASPLGQQECLPCPGSVCTDIINNPASFYANIHTVNNTAGEVRAQLQKA
jgi:hypothetical protein